MNRNTTIPDEEKVNRIRRDCLLLFEQSIGWKFRIKGTPLIDQIESVDWRLMHVCGKQYGNFHIDLCQLTNEETQLVN